MHAGDLADAVDDFLQVFQVGDFEDYVHAGLAILAAGFAVAGGGVGVADKGCDLFEHAEAVVAEKRDFYGIGNGLAVFIAGPEYVDAAVGFVQKISDVRTGDGVDGDSFASDDDVVAVSAKDAAHHAGQTVGCGLLFSFGHRFSAGGREFRQHLAGRVLAVADAGHQVVGASESVFAGRSLQVRFFNFFQRDAIFARFFFDQLFSDFNGAFALVDVEPVLDLVASASGLDDGEPVAAGLMSGLGDNFDDVAGMQLVAKGNHASVDLGARA